MHNQPPAKVGDVVKRSKVGPQWGRCNTAEHVPPEEEYTVTQALNHRFHTELWLDGLDGSYNSADFSVVSRGGGGIKIEAENLTPDNLHEWAHGGTIPPAGTTYSEAAYDLANWICTIIGESLPVPNHQVMNMAGRIAGLIDERMYQADPNHRWSLIGYTHSDRLKVVVGDWRGLKSDGWVGIVCFSTHPTVEDANAAEADAMKARGKPELAGGFNPVVPAPPGSKVVVLLPGETRVTQEAIDHYGKGMLEALAGTPVYTSTDDELFETTYDGQHTDEVITTAIAVWIGVEVVRWVQRLDWVPAHAICRDSDGTEFKFNPSASAGDRERVQKHFPAFVVYRWDTNKLVDLRPDRDKRIYNPLSKDLGPAFAESVFTFILHTNHKEQTS